MPATLTKPANFDQLVKDLYTQSGVQYDLSNDDYQSINNAYHGDYKKFMSDFYKQAGIQYQLSEDDYKSVADHYGLDALNADMGFAPVQSKKTPLEEYNARPFTNSYLSFDSKGHELDIPNRQLSSDRFNIEKPSEQMKVKGEGYNVDTINENLPTIDQKFSPDLDWMTQDIQDRKNKIGDEIKKVGDIGDQNAINYVKNIFLPKEKEHPIVDYEGDNKFTPTSKQTEPLWADYKKLQHADDLLKQAKEYSNAPTKNNLSALWKGLTSPLAKDLLSGGLQEMERNLSVAGSTLTGNSETDKQLTTAYKALKEIQSNPDINPSFLYQTGETISNMIPYIMQFALTRGSGTAVKGMTNQLLKTGTEKTLSNLAKKGAAYTAGAMGQAMTMPMMASQFGEEVAQGKSLGNAFYQAVMKTTGETFGENFGEVGQKLLTKTLGKNSGKIRSAFQQAIGWNGPWEYLEENVTNAWNAALTDERQWKDFWDWKEQGLIALSTSIVGAPMALQNAYAKKRVTEKYRQSEDKLNNLGEGISSSVQSLIEDESPDKTLTNLYRFVTENGIADKQAVKDIFDYTQNRFRYNSMFKQEGEKAPSASAFPEQQINPVPESQTAINPSPEQIRESMIRQEKDYLDKITHRGKGQILAATDDKGNPLYVIEGDRGDISGMLTVLREIADKNGQITLMPDIIHESKVLNPQIVNKEGELEKRIHAINAQFPVQQLSNAEVGETVNYQGKDYAVIEDQGDMVLMVDRANNEIKVPKSELSQPVRETQQVHQPDVRPMTIGKNQLNVIEKQPGSGIYSLDQTFSNEQEAEKAKKEIEKNLGSKLNVSISKQDSGDPFIPDSYTLALKPIKDVAPAPIEQNTLTEAPIDSGLQAQVEQETKPSYRFNGKEVDREYAETAVELAQSKDDLTGLQFKNDLSLQSMIEKKFPAPVQRYLVGKKEVSRSKAMARIDLAKTPEQLKELIIQNDLELEKVYQEKFAEFQKQADQVQAENNRKHDKLVGMMQSYNQSSPAERRRTNTAPIMQLASELGYNVKYENGSGVRIFKNGSEIRKSADRLTDEQIQSHRSLSDYDEAVQKLAGSLMLPVNLENVEIGTMQPKEIRQSILDVQAGKKTVLSNQLLDEIEKIHSSGVVRLKGDLKTGYPGMEIPLDDFVSMINNNMTDADNQAAMLIPEDVALKIEQDQLSPEILNQFGNLIFEGNGNTGQQTTTDQSAEFESSESVPETEEYEEPGNIEKETPEEVKVENISETKNENVSETKEQNIDIQQNENSITGKSLQNEKSDEDFSTTNRQNEQPQQGDNIPEEVHGKLTLDDLISKADERRKIKDEERRVDTATTEAQREAGNYQKGHVKIQGFDISIENPKGSVRSGVDEDGRAWEHTMQNSYGYFKRTQGKDGDQIDVFIGDNPLSENVFVVDQVNLDGTFDEHKILLGFSDIDQARKAYLSNYEEGWQGLGAITPTTIETFREWIGNGIRKRKPFSEYKEVQQTTESNVSQQNLNQDETQNREKSSEPQGETIQNTPQYTSDDRSGSDKIQREDNQLQSPGLRRLKPDERSSVEMKYSLDKNFTFDGSNKIESTDDVAYLFRQLEDRSVENMFACLVKDGKPIIIHMSMGTRWATQADIGMIGDFIGRFNPDKIYLIHNHPSGKLLASKPDIDLHNRAVKSYGDIIGEHVIIDVTSGKYATFRNGEYDQEIKERPEQVSEAKSYKVYNFDRRVFREDTMLPFEIKGPEDVAKFISAQRFTSGKKLSALILNRSNHIAAYLHLPSVDFNDHAQVNKLTKDLQVYSARFGGSNIILSGNDINQIDTFRLNSLKNQLKQSEVSLLDFVSIKSELDYQSMANEGLLESQAEYPKNQTLDEMLQSGSYVPDKIKVDGIERPTRNSNDQLIHPTVVGIKNFWRWFSDSDKAKRIEKLRYSKPVEITGNEYKGKYELNRESAQQWILKNLRDSYTIKDTGEEIKLEKAGAKKITSHSMGNDAHLKSIAAIPEIINNSVFITEVKATKENAKFDAFRYYVLGLKIAGEDYTAKLTIGVKDGKKYYDHSLTEIEKGALIDIINAQPKHDAENQNTLSDIKDKRLLDILQIKSSKVVDDQGRPLVVYHGTSSRFEEFIPSNRGIWLTPDKNRASDYAKNRMNGEEGIIMPLYAKIENPADTETDGNYTPYHELGFDGWISRRPNGEPFTIIVKNSSQIKSATSNEGGFDPNTPVIVKEPGFDYKPLQNAILNDNGSLDTKLEAITAASQAYNHSGNVKVPWDETVDKMREFWSDENLPIRRWEEEILKREGSQDDNSKAYRDMRNSFGRMEALYREFQEGKINPVKASIVKLVKSGVNSDMVLPYTIAKHGLENNREKREEELQKWVKANPEASVFDVKAKEKELSNKDYSGLWPLDENNKYTEVDKLAQDIVDGFESLAQKEDIAEFWKNMKAATDFTLDTWFAGGQIDKKQYEFYKNRFEYFVPLRGWREGAARYLRYKNNEGGIGRSLKSREGRTSLPDNPLAYIQTVGFKAINEQVANEVKQAALELVVSNFGGKFKDLHTIKQAYLVKRTEWNEDEKRDEEVWILYRDEQGNLARPPKEMFDRGEVKSQVFDEHEKLRTKWNAAQHEVIVRKDGGFRVIVFPEKQLSVAQALNGQNTMVEIFGKMIDARKLGDTMLFRFVGGVTNFMKGMMTSYNPVFPFTNFFRDQPEAAITQYIRQNSNIPQMAVKFTPTTAKAIIRHMAGKFDPNNKHDVELKNFYEFGGTTGHTHEKSIETLEKEFKKELAKALRRDKLRGQTLDRVADVLKYIEYWNRIFEDTTRYAVYLSSREKGLTVRDACFESRNASVDFNMKGKGTRMIESLFAFFKACINAGQKNFQLAKRKPVKFASVAATVASLGFLEAMLNDWGDDDDEYYRINDYVRQNYFIMRKFWGDEKEYLRVPLPQFWRGFHALGVSVYDYIKGKSTLGEAIANTFSNMIAGMSPIDVTSFIREGKWSWAPFWPTSIKPMMEVHANRDFMNNPIYREAFTKTLEEQLAESGLNKKNVNKTLKFVTDMAFKAAGGEGNLKFKINDSGKLVYLPDVTDWNPSQVEHLIKGYFGGVGRFGVDFVHTIVQFASPEEEVDLDNVPFINSFIRNVPEEKWQIIDKYNEIEKTVRDTDKYRQEAQKTGDKEKLDRYRNSEYPGIKSVFNRHDKIVDRIMKKYGFEDEKASAEIIKRMKLAVEEVEEFEAKNKDQAVPAE